MQLDGGILTQALVFKRKLCRELNSGQLHKPHKEKKKKKLQSAHQHLGGRTLDSISKLFSNTILTYGLMVYKVQLLLFWWKAHYSPCTMPFCLILLSLRVSHSQPLSLSHTFISALPPLTNTATLGATAVHPSLSQQSFLFLGVIFTCFTLLFYLTTKFTPEI